MEHGFLKAPWEVLMRTFRANHKAVIKEAEAFAGATCKLIDESRAMAADPTTIPLPQERLDALLTRLLALQQRLEAARAADKRGMEVCLARIEHLQRRTQPSFDAAQRALSLPQSSVCISNSDAAQPSNASSKEVVSNDAEAVEVSDPNSKFSYALKSADAMSVKCARFMAGCEFDVQKASRESELRWEKTRLDRVLVDYMLRAGLYASGDKLAKSERIELLVDSTIFRDARHVIQALRRRDCSAALKWCNDNRRRLAKTNSSLEFKLHRQEYIEFARAGNKMRAIEYGRRWNSGASHSEERQAEIERIYGLLAFQPDTLIQPYKGLYSEERWTELEETFKQENYKLHGLTGESTLEILLKAGLASLKTRKCGTDKDRKSNCPTCTEPYLSLSKNLPHSQHVNSILVCAISGEIMDENNPPMALPNGNVYSYNALQDIAARNDRLVIDPKTQETFQFMMLKKCYIM